MSATVKEAMAAVAAAAAATPTPATGHTIAPIGECACSGGSHINSCPHYQGDVTLGQSGPAHPGVTVHMDAYLCNCRLFSSPAIEDIRAHQEESGCQA